MVAVSQEMKDATRRARGMLAESEWMDARDAEAHQIARLKNLVRHAKKQCAEYTAHYADSADVSDWESFWSLPTATKSLLRDAASGADDVLFRATTSGTTGEVMTVDRTVAVEVWRAACQWREYDWSGVDVRLKGAVIRWPIGPETKHWDPNLRGVPLAHWDFGTIGPLLGLGPGLKVDNTSSPEEQAEIIRNFGAEILCGMPTILADIADCAPDFRPAAVFCISEVLTEQDRRRIERGFRAPIHNVYAAVEVGRIAFECPTKSGLHVHSEAVHFEVVDEACMPAAAGQAGTALLTAIHNRATPLIRYQIGDIATMGEPCACGRPLPLIANIDGKTINRIKTASGDFRVASRIVYAMQEIPGVTGFQLRQHEIDRFTIRVAQRQPLDGDEIEAVRRELAIIVGVPCSLSSESVDQIERAPSGKALRVVVDDALLQA
jgi:phenylacetate-CoA ligase